MDKDRTSKAMPEGNERLPGKSVYRRGLRSRWLGITLIGGAIVGVLALCVLILPTLLARWALSEELEKMGISAEGLETLHVNLMQGEVWVGPVHFSSSGREPAQLVEFGFNASLSSLLKRRVLFDRMIVRGLDVHVRRVVDGPITINGIDLTEFAPASSQNAGGAEQLQSAQPAGTAAKDEVGASGWGAGIDDFEFRDSRLLLTSAEGGTLVIQVERLELHDFRTWTPDKPGTFALVGQANGIAFRLEGEARPFADVITMSAQGRTTGIDLDKIKRFTGPLIGLEPDRGVLDIRFDGRVSLFPDGRIEGQARGGGKLNDLHVAKPGLLDARTSNGDVDFDWEFEVGRSNTARLQGSAKTVLRELQLQQPEGPGVSAGTATIALSGLDLARTGSIEGNMEQFTRLGGKLDIQLKGAETILPAPGNGTNVGKPIRVSAGTVQLDAHTLDARSAEAQTSKDALLLRITGAAQAEDVSAMLPDIVAEKPIEVTVQRLQVNLQELSTQLAQGRTSAWPVGFDAQATGVSGKLGDDDASAELHSLAISNASATAGLDFTAEALAIENPAINITRRLLNALRKSAPNTHVQQAQQHPARSPSVALKRAALVGTGAVEFHDSTLQPAVDLAIEIGKLEMRNIDTGKPAQPTTLELAGKLGDLSQFSLSGSAHPFAEQRDFDISAHAEGVQLHRFSGYAAQALGMLIDSGTLQADLDATADEGQLNAVLSLVIRHLDLVERETDQSTRTGAPIDLFIALLEDQDGKIELRVPVAGSFDAPRFDLSDAVGKALTGAVRQVASGALDVVFAPATTAEALFGSKEADSISRPISFDAGSAELGPEARRLTDRLAHLLEQRPRLAVEICGRATAQDLSAYRTKRLNEAMLRAGNDAGAATPELGKRERQKIVEQARPQLERLAGERTRALREQLLAERVSPSRISECRPSFDATDRSEPSVVVSLQAA